MQPNSQYLERFEYFCKQCGSKGTVVDILLNPEVLLIRGYCAGCNARGAYKVVDMDVLRQEHEALKLADEKESAGEEHVFRWRFEGPGE
jgi:hypothetical protein